MNAKAPASPGLADRFGKHDGLGDAAARHAHTALALINRIAVAAIFFMSGRTKVDGWLSVSGSAVSLFRDEYQLPLISPIVAAHLAAYAEHLFPLLLLLGLFTRFAALSLLLMTAVIQIFVYPAAWPTHLAWSGLLLYLIVHGGGALAFDRWLPATSAARRRVDTRSSLHPDSL